MKILIKRYMLAQGGWIADGWSGSATTSVATLQLGMNAFSWDANQSCVKAGRARVKGFQDTREPQTNHLKECKVSDEEYEALTEYPIEEIMKGREARKKKQKALDDEAEEAAENENEDMDAGEEGFMCDFQVEGNGESPAGAPGTSAEAPAEAAGAEEEAGATEAPAEAATEAPAEVATEAPAEAATEAPTAEAATEAPTAAEDERLNMELPPPKSKASWNLGDMVTHDIIGTGVIVCFGLDEGVKDGKAKIKRVREASKGIAHIRLQFTDDGKKFYQQWSTIEHVKWHSRRYFNGDGDPPKDDFNDLSKEELELEEAFGDIAVIVDNEKFKSAGAAAAAAAPAPAAAPSGKAGAGGASQGRSSKRPASRSPEARGAAAATSGKAGAGGASAGRTKRPASRSPEAPKSTRSPGARASHRLAAPGADRETGRGRTRDKDKVDKDKVDKHRGGGGGGGRA
jgi:hypothetical protein